MADADKRPGVWGIDLGQCALKAIRLEEEDGQMTATAFDYVEHPKILSQPDADPDQLTREALEKFLSRNDLQGDQIAIGVAGQSGLARFVKLPPVDEKKIPDIVRFEAKQQIPFPLHEVVWGFQRLGSGTKSDNMVLDAEIGLFAMKRDMIARALQHFKDVGIEVHYIQMAPLALCNFLAHDLLGKGAPVAGGDEDEEAKGGDKNCVVGLDIGTDNSNLVITDGEKIIWQRPIPLGGNHFTRALTKELKLTFAKAEHVKRNAVKSPDLRKILAALKPVLNDFVSEVQRSLGYFTNTHRDATILYMLGLGNAFRLPGLQKYLQEKLQLDVRKLQKIERLSGEEGVTEAPQYVENVLSFAVAHGLALQGLGQTCIYTNLLPPEIAQERAIRAKKPWAAAAAAVLLLISPPLLFGWSAAVKSWKNDEVEKAAAKLKSVVEEANAEVAKFNKAEQDAKIAKGDLLKLAGGVGERLNWVHLNNYINDALPQPDGSRLLETERYGSHPYAKYFAGDEKAGMQAYEQWKTLKELQTKGGALTKEEQQKEDEVKRNLVQVNIEAVAALWSDKLNVDCKYFYETAAKKAGETFPALPFKGWIVEVRGYTYHNAKDVFVKNTFVENLVDLAEPVPKDKKLAKEVNFSPDAKAILYVKDKDKVRVLVSHIFMYDSHVEDKAKPGKFELINKCAIAEKMNVFGQINVFAPVVVAGADPNDPNKKDDPNAPPPDPAVGAPPVKKAAIPAPTRSQWRPPSGTKVGDTFGIGGTAFSAVLGGAKQPFNRGGDAKGGAGGAGAQGGPGGAVIQRPPRTEFIVWFIWQEPLPL